MSRAILPLNPGGGLGAVKPALSLVLPDPEHPEHAATTRPSTIAAAALLDIEVPPPQPAKRGRASLSRVYRAGAEGRSGEHDDPGAAGGPVRLRTMRRRFNTQCLFV